MKSIENEINAQNLKRYFETHNSRKNKENICNGIANWNSCDYIDYNFQQYSANGCLCWKQDEQHNCVRLTEIIIK
jgi:hypothetical protein